MEVEMQTNQKRTGEIEEVTKRQADHQPDNGSDHYIHTQLIILHPVLTLMCTKTDVFIHSPIHIFISMSNIHIHTHPYPFQNDIPVKGVDVAFSADDPYEPNVGNQANAGKQ